jgi:hypothetical protein
MIPDWLDDAVEKAKRATPGPWRYDGERSAIYDLPQVSAGEEGASLWVCVTPFPEANAAYIAACSPERILALVERMRALEEVAEAARAYLTHDVCTEKSLREALARLDALSEGEP